MRDVGQEYIHGAEDLASFFAAPPRSVLHAPAPAAPWDAMLAEAIRCHQERLGSQAAITGDECVIVTGQQPGLFTGPLYAIHKAATAVLLAQRVEANTGVRCLPLFWVAGDDHDFEEARTAHFLGKNHEPFSVRYDPHTPVDGLPMNRVPLAPSLHDAIDRAARETPGSELRDEVAAFLHDSLDASDSLADWTARLLARLFQGTGLAIFSPDLPEARRAAMPVLAKEIADPLASTRLVNEAGERLAALGFPQQVVKGETECAFFLNVDARRRKVLFENGAYRLPEKDPAFTREELLDLLEREPGRFTPNVALRCIVQQQLFPAAAYVAGPGEVAYWAQLKPLFDHFGLPMPVVYPRARCVITRLKLSKLMARLSLNLGDLMNDPDTVLDRALGTTKLTGTRRVLAAQAPRVLQPFETLVEALKEHDPTTSDMAAKMRDRLATDLQRLERAALHQDEDRVAAIRGQVTRLRNALAPWRRPQERVYTVFSFLFEQGWNLVPRLLEELDIESFTMNEVEL